MHFAKNHCCNESSSEITTCKLCTFQFNHVYGCMDFWILANKFFKGITEVYPYWKQMVKNIS